MYQITLFPFSNLTLNIQNHVWFTIPSGVSQGCRNKTMTNTTDKNLALNTYITEDFTLNRKQAVNENKMAFTGEQKAFWVLQSAISGAGGMKISYNILNRSTHQQDNPCVIQVQRNRMLVQWEMKWFAESLYKESKL